MLTQAVAVSCPAGTPSDLHKQLAPRGGQVKIKLSRWSNCDPQSLAGQQRAFVR
jgi:hypothetical protein